MKSFKSEMKQLLKGLRVFTWLLMTSCTIEVHDKILTEVLQRAAARNVKLNFDKLQLHVNEVK